MSLKETIFSMMIEALELSEAVEVRHDRYMRSHGKKARDSGGGSSSWMFTHKPMGDVDVNNKKEVHTAQGKLSDAKKSAQKWAKENDHHTVYIMESVELDEISKKTLGSYIKKAASDIGYAAAADDTNKELKRHKGIAKAANKLTKEEVELAENFKVGAIKLNDGSSVIIKEADAKLLNQLVSELADKNREAMMKTAMKDKKGFNEILGFAKEAL